MEADVITLQDIFIARPPEEDAAASFGRVRLLSPLAGTGLKPHFLDKLAANGVGLHSSLFAPDGESGPVVRDTREAPTFGGYS